VEFAYFDISLDFGALKRFLRIRDNNPLYIPVKEAGRVGIPTILIEDKIYLDPQGNEIEDMLK